MCKQILFFIFLSAVQQLAGQNCLGLTDCPASPATFCDLTANDDLLWNESYWWDAGNQTQNLAETAVQAEFHFTDTCGGALTIYYLLFLDLDGDGARETVVDSRALPGFNTVRYGNGPDAPYDDGTPRTFDERPLPAGQRYGFAIETAQNGDEYTARLRWNTGDAPLTFIDPQLPYGNHLIRWTAEKPGGEQEICEYALDVRDCKPPTVVCINGLSINIMPTGMITLWAADFLLNADDNTSPSPLLQLGIRKTDQGAGFPEDGSGAPLTSLTFDCSELGVQPVELWARDVAGNADYCETFVIVQDPFTNCTNGVTVQIAHCVRQWCSGAPIAGVGFQLGGGPPGMPAFTLFDETPEAPDGCFDLEVALPANNLYTLSPVLESDPLNGVTALDLVRISQHILGLQPLAPYALIAADANKSYSVTVFDIIQIRNLLTGAATEFPDNTSWRFLDAGFAFDNPLNPFATTPFVESASFNMQSDTTLALDFFGIKTGDVDCSGTPGLTAAPASRGIARLTLPDRVLAEGEVVELPLCAVEADGWLGLQFGLQFDPERLVVEAVTPGDLPNWDAGAAAQSRPGRLNVVWYDAAPAAVQPGKPLLVLRLRALTALRLSEVLALCEERLPAEAFTASAESRTLQFSFITPATGEAGIFQPWPNPTGGSAWLHMDLAAPAVVEYELLDLAGRVLFARRQPCDAGAQQLEFPAGAFPGGGVYIWRVRSGAATAGGKLVRL